MCFNQTWANRSPDSTFVDKASSTRSSPKPSSSRVVQLIDLTWVTWPQGKSRVTSTQMLRKLGSLSSRVLNIYLPPIHTRVIDKSASFWWIVIAGWVIRPSLVSTATNLYNPLFVWIKIILLHYLKNVNQNIVSLLEKLTWPFLILVA